MLVFPSLRGSSRALPWVRFHRRNAVLGIEILHCVQDDKERQSTAAQGTTGTECWDMGTVLAVPCVPFALYTTRANTVRPYICSKSPSAPVGTPLAGVLLNITCVALSQIMLSYRMTRNGAYPLWCRIVPLTLLLVEGIHSTPQLLASSSPFRSV